MLQYSFLTIYLFKRNLYQNNINCIDISPAYYRTVYINFTTYVNTEQTHSSFKANYNI